MLYRAAITLLLTAVLAGCGGDRDRGINRDRDRPKSGPPEKEKEKEKAELCPARPSRDREGAVTPNRSLTVAARIGYRAALWA